MVEQLPVGVFAFSADGEVLLWNAHAERLTGWDRARVLRGGLDTGDDMVVLALRVPGP